MYMKFIHVLLVMSILVLISCSKTPSNNLPDDIDQNHTDDDINDFDEIKHRLFLNPFGFSSLVNKSRHSDLSGYYEVSNEIQFLEALMDHQARIIEIKEDLNLGSKYVNDLLELDGKLMSEYRNVYRPHARQPLLHPTLLETGIGQVRLVNRDDLMIFSKEGQTIHHTTFIIDAVHDLVIRNLHFTGIWEWDEETYGQYNRNDWDYFTIEKSNGLWFDHLTFDQAYDGIIDVKEGGQNITLSWSKLSFKPNNFIEDQIFALEEDKENYPYYNSLRTYGLSLEELIIYASFQKKGFNLGNTTDGEGFESITMTFHHLLIENLMDRLPRIRKGDAHLYHIVLDNTNIYNMRLAHSKVPGLINQAIVTTEEAAVLMEHSILSHVNIPIRNHQNVNQDFKYTGAYQIINSELIFPNKVYFGSSFDKNTLWVHDTLNPIRTFQFRNHETIPYNYELIDVYFLSERFAIYPPGHSLSTYDHWLYITNA
jgi:pectate lyase